MARDVPGVRDALGAMLPAIVIGRFEGRSMGNYGLPPRQAFGKLFWMGAAWGLAAITVLLLVLRAVHAFYFGPVALHGVRALRFAVFWGVYFVLVGIFEEFCCVDMRCSHCRADGGFGQRRSRSRALWSDSHA